MGGSRCEDRGGVEWGGRLRFDHALFVTLSYRDLLFLIDCGIMGSSFEG